mmetsp:Transcript_24897/g.69410  ORF Transcript_24897/g.69410 Transcript_24897/m.69410 type:complete len:257 (-) Transcript_24897:282-1052(-)
MRMTSSFSSRQISGRHQSQGPLLLLIQFCLLHRQTCRRLTSRCSTRLRHLYRHHITLPVQVGPGSATFLFVLSLPVSLFCQLMDDELFSLSPDRAALLEFKAGVSSFKSKLFDWIPFNNMCGDWSGVECNKAGRVTKLILGSAGIDGLLPVEISVLTVLEDLFLFNNKFAGPLPSAWSNMRALKRVSLFSNNLVGTLPPSWSTLTNLNTMFVHQNKLLQGAIPSQWTTMRDIIAMDIKGTSIQGQTPWTWNAQLVR